MVYFRLSECQNTDPMPFEGTTRAIMQQSSLQPETHTSIQTGGICLLLRIQSGAVPKVIENSGHSCRR